MGHLVHVKRVEESGKGRVYMYTKHYVLREEIKCCQGVLTNILCYTVQGVVCLEKIFFYIFSDTCIHACSCFT